jgi:tRNA1(Val) A37 N6-methylase TrmN6
MNKDWKIVSTDISDENIEFAQKNVDINNLNNRIKSIFGISMILFKN